MLRTSFSKESEVLGENFEKLIAREGGKAAGLRLLVQAQQALSDRITNIRDFVIPEFCVIDTSFYDRFERTLNDFFEKKSPLDYFNGLDDSIKKIVYFGPESDSAVLSILGNANNDSLIPLIEKFLEDVPEAKNVLLHAYEIAKAHFGDDNERFHVRSSSTVEDFVDDRYWGTFKTSQGVSFFSKERTANYQTGVYFMLKQFMEFFQMKHYSEERYDLDNQGLSLVIQKTYAGMPATAHSSYPEEEKKETKIEVERKNFSYLGNGEVLVFDSESPELMFYTVDRKGCIKVHKGFTGKLKRCKGFMDRVYRNNLSQVHKIKRKDSILSESQVRSIDNLVNGLEELLGYSVNLELTITNDQINVVQLRPVPTLIPDREVKKLESLPKGCVLLAETPFVYGSFRRKGKLVETGYKHTCGFRIPTPYIALHWEYSKAFRWFWEDPNCQGLLNPKEGMVLTHGHSLISRFGKDRESFVFIGVPGLYEKIQGYLIPKVETWTVPWTGTQEQRIFKYTSFDVVIESDGRHGRVYLTPENAQIYEAEKPEALKRIENLRREREQADIEWKRDMKEMRLRIKKRTRSYNLDKDVIIPSNE